LKSDSQCWKDLNLLASKVECKQQQLREEEGETKSHPKISELPEIVPS
jgi:hypothetical protein